MYVAMRRLPIFLVIDVSESIFGEHIANVKQGIHDLASYTVETAYLTVR